MGKASEELKTLLEKEISLMREMLSNLREEEMALLQSDHTAWGKVMSIRSDMIAYLNEIRSKRQKITKLLQEERPDTKPLKKISLEHLVPFNDDASCELFTLLDQLLALIERLNLQNSRNDYLFDQAKYLKELPLYCPVPVPTTARRRTRVATQTRKKLK